jgi:hypothetical protein
MVASSSSKLLGALSMLGVIAGLLVALEFV